MKNIRISIILVLSLLAACGQKQESLSPLLVIPTPTRLSETLSVIVDTDMGEDDMRAILYLLKHPNVEVKAITVTGTGEAHCEPGMRHALGLLALHGEANIPVACGREIPLAGNHTFPNAWRQNADNLYGLSLPEGGSPSSLIAPDLIASILKDKEGKVAIVATGPLTNLAEALLTKPELAAEIRMIYVMGGAVKVSGNVGSSGAGIDNKVAEWNIYIDPHAANILFNSGAPITLIPLDATKDAPVTLRFYQLLENQHTSSQAAFIYDLLTVNLGFVKSGGAQFWDSLTAGVFTDESLVTFAMMEIQVVEEEGPESGYVRQIPGGAKVRVALSADGLRFEETFLSVLNLP